MAPEALQHSKLDQRTDLFALGALGYWLLTGTHAFRATALSELPSLWRDEPLPPSRLAQHVAGASPDIPAELDRVILSLLRVAPDERPRSTADLVNLLDAIAGLKPDAEAAFVQGYLESGAFVGREREQRQFGADLARAARGKPQALLIEATPGMGRTRLLEELALHARISGAIVATAPNRAESCVCRRLPAVRAPPGSRSPRCQNIKVPSPISMSKPVPRPS